MCGIAGIVGPSLSEGLADRTLDAMLPGIAARGPDGVGRFVAPGVALLHTRLAIIDLQTGDQPIWNERRTVACIFNGEIYNYRALSVALSDRGHTFATRSDTEVLVHLYEEYGDALVRHLHGMYAFAIYDLERRRVLLARDRLGIKPLYLSRLAGRIAFASSIDSLLQVGASREPDPTGLVQYLRYYRVPEPRTAFRGVEALPPGHVATIDANTGQIETARGCALPSPASDDAVGDIEGARAAARAAFERSIASHLVADVEVGAFLSGGIDSSVVVAQAQRMAGRSLRTFTVRFLGPREYDESSFAEDVARRLGTRHQTLDVAPAPAELLRTALRAAQQPFAIASFLPLLLLSEQTAKHVKVVLTGDGGDEAGLGYPTYRWTSALRRLPRWMRALRHPERLRRFERRVSARRWHRARRALKFLRGALQTDASAADGWRYDLGFAEAASLLRPEHRPSELPRSPTDVAWDTRLDELEALRQADLQVLLRDEMLPKVDRAGMAFGLEGRVPLLDDEFVDAMLAVPVSAQVTPWSGKRLLRAWARELVPGLDVDRPKHGFDVPMNTWLTSTLHDDADRLLLRPSRQGLVQPAAVSSLWQQVLAGMPGAAHAVYALLMLELWFEGSGRE